MEKPWNKVNFGSGKIVFLDEMQKEDMLQVEYPNQFLLDMGWYQNKYIIQVIQNDDWEHPIKQYRTKEKQQIQVLKFILPYQVTKLKNVIITDFVLGKLALQKNG